MSTPARWWRWQEDTLVLSLRVQPRASRDGVAGDEGDRLRLRLAAPPVDGAANDRLLRFLADAFGVPRSDVTLLAGHSARQKRVAVSAPRTVPGWAAEAFAGRQGRPRQSSACS